jgi:hypothetical protein
MKTLRIRLFDYLVHNNLDVVIRLKDKSGMSAYMEERLALAEPMVKQEQESGTPDCILVERCLEELTKDLRPSKFRFIRTLLKEHFDEDYSRFREKGTLTCEVVNLIESCFPVFEKLGFNETNESDPYLRYVIAGQIKDYLEKQNQVSQSGEKDKVGKGYGKQRLQGQQRH